MGKLKIKSLSSIFLNWQSDFLLDMEKDKKDKKSIANYENVLNKFNDFVFTKKDGFKLKEINTSFMKEFASWRDLQNELKSGNSKLSKWTKENDKKAMKLFFEFIEDESEENSDMKAIEFKKIRWKKIVTGEERKEKINYTNDDIYAYLDYLEKRILNKRDIFSYEQSLEFKLALYGGLRASEICKVCLEDFSVPRYNKDKTFKLVDITIYGKGSTVYKNPIRYDNIKKELSFFKRQYPSKNKVSTNKERLTSLFFSKTRRPLTRFTLYRYFEEICNSLGLGDKGVHILRHTFANNLNDLGIDLGDMQELMRHTDPAVTKVYVKRNSNRLDKAAILL